MAIDIGTVMEIYERKHTFGFAINFIYWLVVLGMSSFVMSIPLFARRVVIEWYVIMFVIVFALLFISSIMLVLAHYAEYKKLANGKKPAIIVNDDSITYYAFFCRKYVTFKLEDIKEFKLRSTKEGCYMQPEFKNPELAKEYKYRKGIMHYTVVARIDYIEMDSQVLIDTLNRILNSTYFEEIYNSIRKQ